MSNKILRHGHASDTAANWSINNPILGKGEIAIESDTGKFKFGNGVDNYNDIDYSLSSLVNNILDDTGTGSIHQKFDGDGTFDFTGKNPNATSLDPTLTGNINKGATGNYASSFGGKSAAMGKRSLAEGTTTIAKGNYSHVEGDNSVALGNDSHAEGYMTVSKGEQSHAEGIRTVSKGTSSHTEGYETESSGAYSHAEGEITKSTGEASHTEGFKTESAGLYSHAEGNNSKVLTSLPSNSTDSSSDTGDNGQSGTTTDDNWNVDEHFGEAAHVEGADNVAIGFASHAEGVNNKAHGHYAHTEGIKNIAGLETEKGIILAPHAEGYNTKAFGNYSHSEGYTTEASGSNSHAEGDQTVASGASSHAEGHNTNASSDYSHSEGSDTIASGASSHAEGGGTKASGDYSHTEGEGTIASKRNQHVQGKFNIEDTTNNYAHIVGNGSNIDLRSNAHTVDWNGNAWYAGDIKVGGNSYSDENAKTLATQDYVDNKYSNIDLSNYYTKSNVDELLAKKINTADSGFDYIIKSADDFTLTTYQSKRIYLINNVTIPKNITFRYCDIISSFKSISSEAYDIKFIDCTINNVNFTIDNNFVDENSPGSNFTNCTLNNCGIMWGRGIYTNNISSCNFINCTLSLPSLGSSPSIDGFTTFTDCKFIFDSEQYPLYLNSNAKVFMSGVLFNNDYSDAYTEIQSSETSGITALLCMVGCSSTNERAIKIQNNIEVKVNTDLNFLTTQSV